MLVYANEFHLAPDEHSLETLKRAIHRWLRKKIGPSFTNTKIIPFAQPFAIRDPQTGVNEVMIFGTPDDAPDYCLSITYRHNDSAVHGRAWFTRIGIERATPKSPLRVTILLETSDLSPQVAANPVTASLPGVVYDILGDCRLDERTPGAAVRVLTAAKAKKFEDIIADPCRHHAILVVSPDDFSEEPCVDTDAIQQRLVGLAQIYEIRDKREAWKLRKLLPSYHTAWDGSITLISPGRSGSAPGRVFRHDDIDAIRHDTGLEFDRHLFNELTHRFNLPKSRRHIGDEVVGRRLMAFKLARLREQASGVSGLEEIVESYEEDRDKAQKHSEELEFKLLSAEEEIERLAGEKQELERQVRTLRFHLNQAGQAATPAPAGEEESIEEPIPANASEAGERAVGKFPDKLILTNHAKKTLNSSPYEDGEKVLAVFTCLATAFHAAFTGTLRMQDAIAQLQESGATYSANQSDITAGMKTGYQRSYKGKKYKLNRHIILGKARDPRHCFRVYFEWEADEKRILVLHAGNHLDTQST